MESRRDQQEAGSNGESTQSSSGVAMSGNVPQTPAKAADDTRSDVVTSTAVKAEPAIKTEKKHFQCEHEAMDTNNNNNLERENGIMAETPAKGRWESPTFSDISQIHITPGLRDTPASAKIPQMKQNGDANFVQGKQSVEQNDRRTGSGRVRSFGPSPFGLISPDFPNIAGTPTSASQLLTLPSSAFSLEGLEFPSPLGSGQFSPLASARLGRKRALSISPLSSSSLDLNSLIRTSPTSLVNYITNSRGSSAGSIGHLSPSLFSNPALFQSRPLQVSLRNSSYPLQNTTTAAHQKEKSDTATDMAGVHIKKEEGMETSQPSAMMSNPLAGSARNPMLMAQSDPLFQNSGLATVQEEPPGMLGSSEDEGMYAEPTDYSSAITENESEIDRKPVLGLDKPKRVYYSYPSVEEPHNNQCRWSSCDKNCDNLEDLVRHVNSDHIYRDSRKDFICYWSGCVRKRKPFKAQYMLLVHMRRHTGEKPHKCTYDGCNKAYSRLENLKTHLRSHTGERPYVCKYEGCGKAFSNASDCAKHMNRTHSDEKPYACPNPGCTKRYTDPSSRRKHMKNCQVNKKARTEDRDAMSGADEESSAETGSTRSSTSSKKSTKPRKSEKRKSNPVLRTSNAPPFAGQTADHGYVSGGSQGYVSSQTGYNSSGYDTENPSLSGEGPEEITRILRGQTLSDPADVATSRPPHFFQQTNPVNSSSHVTDYMTPNVRASRQKDGGLMMPAGQAMNPLPPKPLHAQAPPHQYSQWPSHSTHFQPSFQSGFSNFNSPHSHNLSSSQPPILPARNEASVPISAHHIVGGDFTGNGKVSRTASSGYSSFRSMSPTKNGTVNSKSPSDDCSIFSSSVRSSNITNSYSTFSSNSSRLSSPCSNSGQSDSIRPHPPRSPLHEQLTNFPLRQAIRMTNSYPPKQAQTYSRRNSDNLSDSGRSWQFSSQSSRYSYSGSELSDDLLDSLPSNVRRDSFSKNQPLPLPESMQHDFSPMDMPYGTEQNGTMGMDFGVQSNGPLFQNVEPDHLNPTFPLHHFDNGYSQDGLFDQGSGDGYETLFNGMRTLSPSNMVVGDMASFVGSLPEETQYFEQLMLGSQVK